VRGLSSRRVPMRLPVIFLLYRIFRAEYFIIKTGYYLVEWVGAKKLGLVVTKVPAHYS
jgi:hypothetical protein